MRPSIIVLLSLAITCCAQSWQLDPSCAQYDADAIAAAFKEAVNLAKTAHDVLENNYGTDEKVQQMVKYVLGDGPDLQAKVEKVKGTFRAVGTYNEVAYAFSGTPLFENTDLRIFCDMSNFEKISKPDNPDRYLNKATGNIFADRTAWDNLEICHDTSIRPGTLEFLPMTMTLTSNSINWNAYNEVMDTWKASGSIGQPPDWAPYFIQRRTKPNTMDLCAWFLTWKRDEKWQKVNAEMIAAVQDPAFIAGLHGDNKAIDAITETLGANLLHELTHTNLGGLLKDIKSSNGGSYGWVNVGALHDENNADSINVLGVALNIWKLGFYVDNDGLVKKLP